MIDELMNDTGMPHSLSLDVVCISIGVVVMTV